MSLADEYRRQSAWRDFASAMAPLVDLRGQTVLDLGCGVGEQAAMLAQRGARVIGIDHSAVLIEEAQIRPLPECTFRVGDLRCLPDLATSADGIWCSFGAAYFPDLPAVLKGWALRMRPGGWILMVEMDDLFRHAPLPSRTRTLLDAYAEDAIRKSRYHFRMGRELPRYLKDAGFDVDKTWVIQDQELAFDGPASHAVLAAWRDRLNRMSMLQAFCGEAFETVRADLLDCLQREDHSSGCKVWCCLAHRPALPADPP